MFIPSFLYGADMCDPHGAHLGNPILDSPYVAHLNAFVMGFSGCMLLHRYNTILLYLLLLRVKIVFLLI